MNSAFARKLLSRRSGRAAHVARRSPAQRPSSRRAAGRRDGDAAPAQSRPVAGGVASILDQANRAIVEELQQDGRRHLRRHRRGRRPVRGRRPPAGPEDARGRHHADRGRHRPAAGRVPQPGHGRHPGRGRLPGRGRTIVAARTTSTTWSCAPAPSTSWWSWSCEDEDRLLELLNGVDPVRSPACATPRLHVPEAGQADLHLGDQMTDHRTVSGTLQGDSSLSERARRTCGCTSPGCAYRRPRDPGHRAGRGGLGLRPARQALPRRPVRPVHQPGRPRPDRAGRGGGPAGQRAGLLPDLELRPPEGDRAGRPAGRADARATQPHLLHHRRVRGGRVGLEAGPAVLQGHRAADPQQGDQPQHRLPRGHHGRPLDHRHARHQDARSSPWCPGRRKVPNTNFYRAPYFADDLEAFGRWAADDIEQAILMEGPDTVAAVFLEPVQNAGGCFPPPPGYFQRVRGDLRPLRRAARLRRGDLRLRAARRVVRRRALRLPARHHHHGQGPDQRLLPARGHGRQRPAGRALPARRRASSTASPSPATRSAARWPWPTSTSSRETASSSHVRRHRGRLPGRPRRALRPAHRRRRPGCRATSTGSSWSRTRTPGRPSTTTSPSGCSAASCRAPCTRPGSSAGPTTGATRWSSWPRRSSAARRSSS